MRTRVLAIVAAMVLAVGTVATVAANEPPPQADRGLARAAKETTAHVPIENLPAPAFQKVREAASFSWGETQP